MLFCRLLFRRVLARPVAAAAAGQPYPVADAFTLVLDMSGTNLEKLRVSKSRPSFDILLIIVTATVTNNMVTSL